MNEPFDFQVYFQKEEIQGYYGFIRPDGGFYRVRPKEWEDVDTFLIPNHDGVYLLHQLEQLSIPQEQLRTARIVASHLEDQHSKK